MKIIRLSFANVILILLIMTLLFPMLIQGLRVIQDEDCFTNKQMDCYNNSWYLSDGESIKQNNVNVGVQLSDNIDLYTFVNEKSPSYNSGPMNSSWPMLGHDLHHTGQSPYSTADNLGFEKWWFKVESYLSGSIQSSAVIDINGKIFFGSMGADCQLYALYPNGTKIWNYGVGTVWSTPAIDENGVIYVSTTLGSPDYLYAIYTNNGALKWKYPISGTLSSPAIADDGTIVFGDQDNYKIIALYPNGTLKWGYYTNGWTSSSPAIAEDGTIYCGSRDNYLYALYPDGTLHWKFGTGGWIKGHPSIDEDGTIYVPSFDGYLYALYPNGTMKWRADTGGSIASAGCVIGLDGTLYVGTERLRALYPGNGTVKWVCDIGGDIYGTVPAVSADGTIYVSVDYDGSGGDLVAVNSNGTVRWRKRICNQYARSSPCIGEDGTIYVGSTIVDEVGYSLGYLHAFNNLDPDAPSVPIIDGTLSGRPKKEYKYTFKSTSPLGNNVYYYVDWGDGYWTDWVGPYNSSEKATLSHAWSKQGTYNIRARAKDTDNLWGPWGEQEVAIPRNKIATNTLFLHFLERFLLLQKLLSFLTIYN